MTAIAIALGMVALFWMAATNIGADTGSETAEAAPTSGETQRPASEWQNELSDHGLLCFALNEHTLRLVIHLQIDEEQIDQAIQTFTKVSTE